MLAQNQNQMAEVESRHYKCLLLKQQIQSMVGQIAVELLKLDQHLQFLHLLFLFKFGKAKVVRTKIITVKQHFYLYSYT